MKEVVVLVGAGSIGQAIARRVGAGKHVVLGDLKLEAAQAAAKIFEDAGFDTSAVAVDISERESVLKLVEHAQSFGAVKNFICAAGVSPSQAPVEKILRVDLYGTAVLLEEFGKVIADGGSGVVISSQSGHRLGALTEEQNFQLATTPTEELLDLPFIKAITDSLKAYQYSKRCNSLRVAGQATPWGKRGATINSISPGIIITRTARRRLSQYVEVFARRQSRYSRRSGRSGGILDEQSRTVHQRRGLPYRRRHYRFLLVWRFAIP